MCQQANLVHGILCTAHMDLRHLCMQRHCCSPELNKDLAMLLEQANLQVATGFLVTLALNLQPVVLLIQAHLPAASGH